MKKFEGFTKGVNLGGWLSQNDLTDEHISTFIKEEDIARIKSWGVDHIRVPLDYSIIENEDGTDKPNGYEQLDNCLAWCKKYGLHMVLDLHKTAGYIFDDFENCAGFWTDEALQNRFLNLWDKMSKRYANESDIMAFELLNEVVDPAIKEIWNDLVEKAIEVIRKNTTETWIIVGGSRNNSIISVKELRKPTDPKVVLNFHCYEPLVFTHQAAYWVGGMTPDYRISFPKTLGEYLTESRKIIGDFYSYNIVGFDEKMCDKDFFVAYFQEAIEIAKEYDAPLYCGEYGVIDQANPEETLLWFKEINAALEECGIGRCVWSYKEMDFGLIDEHYASVADEIIKYL